VVEDKDRMAEAREQPVGEGLHRQPAQRMVGKGRSGDKAKACDCEKFFHVCPLWIA